MAHFRQEEALADGWTHWIEPIMEGYKMSCCDCGCVHDMDFRIRDGRVQFKVRRNNRSTGQVRRHMRQEDRDMMHDRNHEDASEVEAEGAEPDAWHMVVWDEKNGTHALTNGRARLSVWAGEANDPDLASLDAQLRRGAALSTAANINALAIARDTTRALRRQLAEVERERERMREMLVVCRDAIGVQPIDAFGSGRASNGQEYPIRDEITSNITAALAPTGGGR